MVTRKQSDATCVVVGNVPKSLRRLHVTVRVRKNMHAYTSVVNPWKHQGMAPRRHMLSSLQDAPAAVVNTW